MRAAASSPTLATGAVFNLARTHKPNVFEFSWEEQTDPVVYISNQRMEELRELAGRTAAQEVHLEEALLRVHVAEREREIAPVAGA